MLDIPVLNSKGIEVDKVRLSDAIASTPIDGNLLHSVVLWQRSARRAGTHKTKTRAEVSGGGIKPWRQKGTGKARAGSNTSAIWVGGGIAHGPKPRDYSTRMNKKERSKALLSALVAKINDGSLKLVNSFDFLSETDTPSTKKAIDFLSNVGVKNDKRSKNTVTVVLPIVNGRDQIIDTKDIQLEDNQKFKKNSIWNNNLAKSLRNIPQVELIAENGINVYQILKNKNLLMTSNCFENLTNKAENI